MRRYHISEVENVKNLRQVYKYSFAHLQKLTGIPQTTIRLWCKNEIKGTKWDTLMATNNRIRAELKQEDVGIIRKINKISPDQAKLFVALLYWCEGSKYPSSTAVTIVNSDMLLIRTFIKLLRHAYVLDEEKFHVHMQIHDTHDYEKIKTYWSEHLNIPMTKFIRPTITKPRSMKHRDGYYGTCTVKYQDYRLLLRIMGIYEQFVPLIGEVA